MISLNENYGKHNCVERTLKRILDTQQKVAQFDCECINQPSESSKPILNTIPFILYNHNSEPFEATGITSCFDEKTKKEKFICFTTFIFKIIDLEENCAVVELLKFKNHGIGSSSCAAEHFCSPCCQISWENVEDLSPTCICIDIDLSCFCAVSCFPPVLL